MHFSQLTTIYLSRSATGLSDDGITDVGAIELAKMIEVCSVST